MPNITPFLWFDTKAEEAANYYCSVFPNSKVNNVVRYNDAVSEAAGMPAGTVLVVDFELDGKPFSALNGGPMFTFSEAISFSIGVKDQEELDYYWNTLTSDGGEESMCGWLKDKYGLSWQVVPSNLGELMGEGEAAERTGMALMGMHKIVIADLVRARDGG